MRLPRMSTGAWIFAGLVAAAVIVAPVAYAAVASTVAIGNKTNSFVATVTPNHQLLTTLIDPSNVISKTTYAPTGVCTLAYTPPAGKAIVLTSLTYDLGSGTAGTEQYLELTNGNCSQAYDIGDTTQAFETEQRIWPTGLPLASVGIYNPTASAYADFTGYLIPATSLPAAARPGGAASAILHGKPHEAAVR